MILAVVGLLLALAVGGAAALFVARDPGYLLVAYDGATLETSLWFALLCGSALVLALLLISYACRRLLRAGTGVAAWAGERRARRAQAKAQRGTILLAEGRWREAIDDLLASARAGGIPLANYLGAARAANRLGSYDERDDILASAGKALPDAAFAVELTRAELQQAAGQWQQSARTLHALRERAPRHPRVQRGLLAAHRALGDAEAAAEVAALLPNDDASAELREDAWRARLAKSQGSAEAAVHARNTWRAVPKKLRESEALVLAYVDMLAGNGAESEAETVLRRAIKKHWRRAWVLRYGTIGGDAAARRAHAGQWRRGHAADAALQLTLGRLAVADGDLAAARQHLLASLDLETTPAVLAELGGLCAAQGDHLAATEYLQRALDAHAKDGTGEPAA